MKNCAAIHKNLPGLSRMLAMGVFVICGTGSAAQERPFDPARQQRLSTQDKRMVVRLSKREPCATCPSASRFTFEIQDRATKGVRTLVLENETAQIDAIHLAEGNKLAIFGRVLANTSLVTLVDTLSGKPNDSFFCFKPTLSPNGRFVAFQKVYPAHFTSGVSAQYLIYDIRATPEENRESGIPIDNRIDVGRPIFPEDAENKPGDNLNVSPEKQHTMASSEFYWSRDGKTVMFVDRAGGSNTLIRIDVSGWPKPARVSTLALETTKIVDAKRCPNFEKRLEEAFHVVGIVAKGDAAVTLSFRSHNPACLRQPAMTVALN